ncbi:MAG: hypothetical protein IPG45_30850 [Deltaproteobacteria bacterium]|nr:hypothetical protein [Deltaproteobacteria bacterium]
MKSEFLTQFLHQELPQLISAQKISSAQVLETIGALGLLHDAVAPDLSLPADLDEATNVFIQRVFATYPDDPSPKEKILSRHLSWAFTTNPALVQFAAMLRSAAGASQDKAAQDAKELLDIVRPGLPEAPLTPGTRKSFVDVLADRAATKPPR